MDADASPVEVIAPAAAGGSYPWVVTGPCSANCLVRVSNLPLDTKFGDSAAVFNIVPGTFTLFAPGNGASGVSLTPTLDWLDSAAATTYTLLVDDDSGFGTPVINDATIVASTYTIGAAVLSAGTTYYWRVTAVSGRPARLPRTTTSASRRFCRSRGPSTC